MSIIVLTFLESVDFQLIGSHQTSLSEPATNFRTLISLKLKDFSVFRMFDHGTIACEFLWK